MHVHAHTQVFTWLAVPYRTARTAGTDAYVTYRLIGINFDIIACTCMESGCRTGIEILPRRRNCRDRFVVLLLDVVCIGWCPMLITWLSLPSSSSAGPASIKKSWPPCRPAEAPRSTYSLPNVFPPSFPTVLLVLLTSASIAETIKNRIMASECSNAATRIWDK